MISVKDLKFWIEKAAVGRSTTCPDGWVSGEKLTELAEKVSAKEPLNYNYRDNPNYEPGHCFTICKCEKCGEYHEAALEHICRRRNSYPIEDFAGG